MGTSRTTIAAIAALSTVWPGTALPQGSVGTSGTTSAATTTTSGTTAATAAAQPAAPASGGLQVDINVSSKLTIDDNFNLQQISGGTSTIWDNPVSIDVTSVTGVQDFSLTGSGVLRYADIPGRTVSGFEDPTIRLRYQLDGVNSRLSLNARYRNVDREFLDPFKIEQEEANSNGFYFGGGTVTFKNAALNFVTGLNDPLTFTLDVSRDERDYDATAEAANRALFDSETNRIAGTVAMKLSPLTLLNLKAGVAHYTANDSGKTDRTTTDYAIGVTQDINPVLVLDASLGYTEVETDTTSRTDKRDGVTGNATLTQTMPNGTIFGTIGSTINQNGTTTTLRFGRDLQLPLGNLSASIGGAHTPSGDTHVVATLAYDRQIKDSNIAVSLTRGVSTNGLNQDVLDTRLSVAYAYDINANSRLGLSMNWGQSETAGIGAAPTIERTNLQATYSYDLTSDWALTGGVNVRRRSDSAAGVGDAQSNSVFVSLGRTFSYRP